MEFNGWTINIIYKGECEVLTNNNTFAIINEDDDFALFIREKDGILKVNKINYNSDFYINQDKKELTLEIHNPLLENDEY
ncbi:hypothetical protein FH144_07745 [Staphylococcus caledonicus]|uniref:hypothetical protein n=1 Tax=Staphylococcus sp. acrmy TaxID=2929076 RepID=UPI001F5A3CC7|nr:hypothetical protein [Staphylococcus sp. acrmy]MCI2948317.1 hypothetical protein [Staphylococcus sp. acrmy]